MQASQIKVGEAYAYKRGGGYFRFYVNSITTHKAISRTTNTIEGYILEDRKSGTATHMLTVEPSELDGAYDTKIELVKRAEQEAAEKKQKEIERHKAALRDRLALYAFVGEKAPSDPTNYRQLFRLSYGSDVDISSEGTRAIIDRVLAMKPTLAAAKEPAA